MIEFKKKHQKTSWQPLISLPKCFTPMEDVSPTLISFADCGNCVSVHILRLTHALFLKCIETCGSATNLWFEVLYGAWVSWEIKQGVFSESCWHLSISYGRWIRWAVASLNMRSQRYFPFLRWRNGWTFLIELASILASTRIDVSQVTMHRFRSIPPLFFQRTKVNL